MIQQWSNLKKLRFAGIAAILSFSLSEQIGGIWGKGIKVVGIGTLRSRRNMKESGRISQVYEAKRTVLIIFTLWGMLMVGVGIFAFKGLLFAWAEGMLTHNIRFHASVVLVLMFGAFFAGLGLGLIFGLDKEIILKEVD